MNMRKNILIIIGAFACASAAAKTAEFFENAFAAPASEKLIAQGQKAAELIGYEKAVEMASPKKAGIEINPLNKFIYGQINPQTQNAVIVANPEWLSLMPEEQQFFLIARALMMLKEVQPFSMKMVHYAYMVLSFLLVIGLFFLFRKTVLKNQKTWISILAAFVSTIALEFFCLDPLEAKLLLYLGSQHNKTVNELVVQKTQDREAGIKALEFYDAAVEKEYAEDPKFWASLKGLLGSHAEALKKNS
jgi:hypothetical protein